MKPREYALVFRGKRKQRKNRNKKRIVKNKREEKNKRLEKQGKKAASAPKEEDADPKISDAVAKDPAPQKEKMQAREKKEAGKGKTQQKVQDESEDEIPLLVPIGTPAKENIEVQNHAAGKKSQKKSPGPNRPRGKKRKACPGLETPKAAEAKTPGNGPEKKPRIKEEAEKERNFTGEKRPKTEDQKARSQVLYYC